MKLNISNFAKIDNADIIIDGITVIAGENNTGKSTIGKILFSIFNSLYDINEKIQGQRISEINANNRKIIQNHINVQMDFKTYRQYTLYVERYVNNIIFNNETFNKDEIAAELNEQFKENNNSIFDDYDIMLEEIADNIIRVMNISNDVIRKEIISRYFNSVFNRQINSLSSDILLKLLHKLIPKSFSFFRYTTPAYIRSIGLNTLSINSMSSSIISTSSLLPSDVLSIFSTTRFPANILSGFKLSKSLLLILLWTVFLTSADFLSVSLLTGSL